MMGLYFNLNFAFKLSAVGFLNSLDVPHAAAAAVHFMAARTQQAHSTGKENVDPNHLNLGTILYTTNKINPGIFFDFGYSS